MPRNLLQLRQDLIVTGLFLIVFVMGADAFIISPLLPTIAQTLHTPVNQTAFAVTTYAIGYAGGAPFFGPLGDAWGHRRLLFVGLSLFIGASVLCAVVKTLPQLLWARLFTGLGAALTLPNVWGIIGEQFTGSRLNKMMGITMAGLSLSIAIGVPLGTILTNFTRWQMIFPASLILCLFAGGVTASVLPKQHPQVARSLHYRQHFQALGQQPVVLAALAITLIWMTGFYAFYTFLGTELTQTWRLTSPQLSTVFILYGSGNFLASFFAGFLTTRLGALRSVARHGWLSTLVMLGFLLISHHLPLFDLLLIALAASQGLGVTALSTFIVSHSGANRATAMALNSSLLYCGLTIGSAGGSLLFAATGWTGIILLASCALGLASSLATWLHQREH